MVSVVRDGSEFLARFRLNSGKRVRFDDEDMRVHHHIDVPRNER